MAAHIVKVLNDWINIFDQIEKRIKAVGSAAEGLVASLQTVPDRIEAIEKKICKNDTCLGPVISAFMKKGNFDLLLTNQETGFVLLTDLQSRRRLRP
jgi:hypothetical protein